MKQGLLDFGADFEADLARAAEWIEHNIKAINEIITLLKQGKKLGGKKRVEARAVADMPATEELRQFRATGTRNTELAAALATLGFTPGDTGTRIAHEARGHVWLFPPASADGRWQLQERMARWADDAWCATEGNTDPIAAMADAFWNLRHLRRSLRDARVYIQAQNGQRTVLVRRDASAETWAKAEEFLTRK